MPEKKKENPTGKRLSFYDEITIEVVRKIMKESLEVVRFFCKLLITISTGLIPLHFTVLNFLSFPKTLSIQSSIIALFPVLMFILSITTSAITVLPYKGRIVLSDLSELKKFREKIISKKYNLLIVSLTMFLLGLVCMAILYAFLTFRVRG